MREKNYEQYKRLFRFAEALLVLNVVGISFALTWYEILNELSSSREIVEYAPDRYISRRRLELGGITSDSVREFCDAVYDFASDEEYFTIKSLKDHGFSHEIFDFGFEDFFYANLLKYEPGLSYGKMFGSVVFMKGQHDVMRKPFVSAYVKKHKSIDVYDIVNNLKSEYGLPNVDRSDIKTALYDTDIFYDEILDRMYANEYEYRREVESDMEVF